MSRVELAPSYRASQDGPASCGTIRGATAPTAGSAKCGSSRSSQPGSGTQSESRNATSSVAAAASPVLRAAPGPPLTGRRITRAPYRAAMPAIAAGSADASSTTMTSGRVSVEGATARRPARQRASSACRSRTGITTVTAGARRASTGPESPRSVRDDAWGLNSGWARPASSRRRASNREASPPGSGVPENQPLTWRAPASTAAPGPGSRRPAAGRPATNRAPGSRVSRRPAGAAAKSVAAPDTPTGRRSPRAGSRRSRATAGGGG